jgi:cytochrome c oxidase subunit 2
MRPRRQSGRFIFRATPRSRHLTWRVLSVALTTLAAASTQSPSAAPLDYFLHAAGPATAPTRLLGWALTAISVLVAFVVAALLLGALLRRRPPAAADSVHADEGGMRFVWIGTALSSIALFAMLAYVLVTLDSVAAPAQQPRLTITVTAYDWWWKVDYDNPDAPTHHLTTANEIRIPAGEPVAVELRSADVIHAFWVPQLAGKTQAIPGVVNQQWIQADHPGVYRGQCSQFCGAQHAHMAFEVIAQTRSEFDTWYVAQIQPTTQMLANDSARAGQQLFIERCAGCHAIRGTNAAGAQAPDLTHLNSRRLIAAGTLVNNEANQLDWIRHAQQIKPDSLMPSIALSADDARELSAYLRTLH